MKVKLSYLPEEAGEAEAVLTALRRRYPQAKVRSSDRHPPRLQLYISTDGGKGGCNSGRDTVQ